MLSPLSQVMDFLSCDCILSFISFLILLCDYFACFPPSLVHSSLMPHCLMVPLILPPSSLASSLIPHLFLSILAPSLIPGVPFFPVLPPVILSLLHPVPCIPPFPLHPPCHFTLGRGRVKGVWVLDSLETDAGPFTLELLSDEVQAMGPKQLCVGEGNLQEMPCSLERQEEVVKLHLVLERGSK